MAPSSRMLSLLSLLQTRRDWPGHQLAARLDVSPRTIRRDVDRLRELGYAVAAIKGPDGGYRLEPGAQLPPLLLDDEQVVAIAIALRAAPALGAGVEEAAERALGTIRRLLPSRLAHRLDALEAATAAGAGGERRGSDTAPAALVEIGDAIRRREELRFEYASPGRGATARDAAPVAPRSVEAHHLVLHGGRWYVVGFDAARDDWRTFRVDRMRVRGHTGRRFSERVVPGGDAVRFLEARFRGSAAPSGAVGPDAWPVVGEATLAADPRRIAPFIGDGTAVADPADPTASVRVRLGSWSWPALAAALLRFDADVSRVEPAELRAAFAQLASRAEAAAGDPRG